MALHDAWQLTATAPHAAADPQQLLATTPNWRAAIVPGTVAQSLGTAIDDIGRYDAQDWWYRCQFRASAFSPARMIFEGLATLADIWLNGEPILTTSNMFIPHRVDIGTALREDNELVICFRSLDAALAVRRPRPRWKTALVDHQSLRWFRTTLLGHIPAWTPAITAVGPWQSIFLEYVPAIDVAALDIQTSARGGIGRIKVSAQINNAASHTLRSAKLWVGDESFDLNISAQSTDAVIAGDFSIADVALWWPHTHGEPHLISCRIEAITDSENIVIDCGRIGFKEISVDRSNGQVQLCINGVAIFCRGACWTMDDFIALQSAPEQLRQTLQLARDAGANMLRIGGTMIYESEEFYRLCDELGLLVWEDFMFANMDYPFDDTAFFDDAVREVTHHLKRWQKHPCLAVYCGGSEIEQQAAMLGLPAAEWSNQFFSTALPQLCAQLHADIPYFPSSPCEGALPFHVGTGISHYYGVGAYRRPLGDVKQAGVKFTSECLGFSNVPDAPTMALLLDGVLPVPHHPRWKARVPRDNGAGLDFEDVRDFYLRQLFAVDPIELRSRDPERYYALSRAVSGEVMHTVFAEWRKPNSQCGGGIVWFYKDLWPGAGWGIVDSTNRPKAAYWYLRRAWATQAVLLTDNGLDGLQLHIINETAAPLNARIEFEIYQHGKTKIAGAQSALTITARGTETLLGDTLLGRFYDTTYAFRFGPPQHDVVTARLLNADDSSVIAEDFYFPQGLALPTQEHTDIHAEATFDTAGNVVLTLTSDVFLQSVALSTENFMPDSNYFHLAPQQCKRIYFTAMHGNINKFKVYIDMLNCRESLTVRAERTAD
jgi:beta-mannosidase